MVLPTLNPLRKLYPGLTVRPGSFYKYFKMSLRNGIAFAIILVKYIASKEHTPWIIAF